MKIITKLFALMLLTGCVQQVTKTIDIIQYASAGTEDYTPVVRDIIDVETGNFTMKFPDGVFHFYPDMARGKYHAITNHDNGYYRFVFMLSGKKSVTIEGSRNTEFIFHGRVIPFLIEKSDDITVRNITIDWERPFHLQGNVVASDARGSSCDIEIPEGYGHRLEQERLIITGEGWEHDFLGENLVFDPKRKAPIYRTRDYSISVEDSKHIKAEKMGDNRYRLTAQFLTEPPPAGSIITFKGMMGGANRTSPAFHLSGTRNTVLENVTIHHCGGMGVIGERSENIRLDRVRVALREGSDRIVTTTADATHFCNCRGKLTIENCLFENMLDDATNVHGTYMGISGKMSERRVIAFLNHFQQQGYDFGSPGDTVQFIDRQTMAPKGTNIIESVDVINERICHITFRKPLPADLNEKDGIENISWYPDFVFRNNIVRNNRARGILVSNGRRSLVEGNTFSSMMFAILVEGDMNHWFESGANNDLTIRNNTFCDSGYGGPKGTTIYINPRIPKLSAETPFEKNIRITGNTFRTFTRDILDAVSTDGLVFEDNVIEDSATFPPISPNVPTVKVRYSRNFVFRNNDYRRREAFAMQLDSLTTETARIEKNF